MLPCGSHFLVLSMLKPDHIGEVRRWLTGDDPRSKVSGALKLNMTSYKEVDYLDEVLTQATGGAPRLLLYTLRALAYLQCSLNSRAEVDEALIIVYNNISKVNIVCADLLPPGDRADASAHFSYLLALSLAGPLERRVLTAYAFQVRNSKVSVARMMRFQPFFCRGLAPTMSGSASSFRASTAAKPSGSIPRRECQC